MSLLDIQAALMFLTLDPISSSAIDTHRLQAYTAVHGNLQARKRLCWEKVNEALFQLNRPNLSFVRGEEPQSDQTNYKIVLRLCQKLREVFSLHGLDAYHTFQDPVLIEPLE
jgi:hypothetical protein